ncbi:MAG: HAD family hydrolase [Pseudomonadota bacterium]|nr:HAD family hydrolase [Pseudomonadota bacterium]
MIKFKYILLDCDGVLYDKKELSLRDIYTALHNAAESLGLDEHIRKRAINIKKENDVEGMINYMHLMCDFSGVSFDELACKHVELIDYAQIEKDDYFISRMLKLKDFGYKLVIASNNHKQHIEKVLTHLAGDLWKDLDLEIFHGSSFKSGVQFLKKPQLEFYEAIINTLNCKPEDISFFDDDIVNVKAAKELGIDAWFDSPKEH